YFCYPTATLLSLHSFPTRRSSDLIGIFIRTKDYRITGHHLTDLLVRIIDQQALDRQHALEHPVIVDHEQLVGMPGQLLETAQVRSEEHTSELQSRENLVCRLLLEK